MALKVGELFATLNLATGDFESGLGSAAKAFKKFGLLAADAALSAAKAVIGTGMQFEAAMSQVAAISGATGAELELLTETAKHYGETTMFSASQAAEALNYMALAGWDAQQSTDALGGVLNMAAASGMDLAAASDAVTDYLSAFNMEASKAGYLADLMAYAQSKSNTTAAMLADAYGNAASSMNAAGQDIETTTAMLMALANQGIKGAEAGTQMAAMMRDMTQRMSNGRIMIGKTAVEVADAAGNFRDLSDILVDVDKAIAGMGTAEASSALMETFSARSVKAVQTILNAGMASVNEYEAALRGSAGTAAGQAETMLDNLQGDVKIFQSALEGLQITASESTTGISRGLVQQATEIVSAINKGGKVSGLSGMADALLDQIPKLLPKAVKAAGDLLKGVASKLPGLVKKLVGTLPDLIGSAGDLIPELTDFLTDALSAAVEGVITNLPEIVGGLIKGIGRTLASAGNGALKLVASVFSAADDLLFDTPQEKLDRALQTALDTADDARVKELSGHIYAKYTFDPVEIDTEAYTTAMTGAMDEIRAAVDGASKLNESDKEALENAILEGSGANALRLALEKLDIPQAEIESVQGKITGAFTTLNATLAALELDDTQLNALQDAIAKGDDIQAALEGFGLDPETAGTVAGVIKDAAGEINGALGTLNVDQTAVWSFYTQCGADGALIASALQMLGVPQDVIDSVMESYDTVGGTLGGKITSAFNSLKSSLTNGIPDSSDPAFAQAKEKVSAFFDEAFSVVEQWETEKVRELEESGLTGTALEDAIADVHAQAESYKAEIQSMANTSLTFMDENAGAAASVAQGHFDQLDAIVQQMLGLQAQISGMEDQLSSRGATHRRAVEQGLIIDQAGQLEAYSYNRQELDHALQQAQDATSRALEEAGNAFGKDTKAYAERYNAIMQDRADAESAAWANYNDHLSAINYGILLAGNREMIMQTPELALQLNEHEINRKAQEALSVVIEAFTRVTENTDSSAQAIMDAIESGAINIDYSAIASGLKMDPEEFKRELETNINGNIFGALSEYMNELADSDTLADALPQIDTSGFAAVYAKALEDDLITAVEGVDPTGAEAALKGAMDALGASVPQGMESAIRDNIDLVEDASKDMGQASIDTAADTVGMGSPARELIPVGESVSQGVALGIQTATATAEAAARSMAARCISALNGISKTAYIAGQNFGQGFVNGMASKLGAVTNAAMNLARGAVNTLRSGIQEGSPSKLTMKSGGFFGEGFAIGIMDSLRDVRTAASGMAAAASGAVNLPRPGFGTHAYAGTGAYGGYAPIDYDALADAMNQRQQILTLNGRAVASINADNAARANNARNKAIALGYGINGR